MSKPTFEEMVAALEQSWDVTSRLCHTLATDDWERPTGCPGWTVKDVVSHIVGLERAMAGDPQPDVELPADLPHVRDDMGRYLEAHVHARRGLTGQQVLAELDEVRVERIAALRAIPDATRETDVPAPLGMTAPAKRMLPIRIFDCWVHDQDVRRAVGRPGNHDGLAARAAIDRLVKGARHALTQLDLAQPATVALDVDAAAPIRLAVRVGDGGGQDLDPGTADADVRLTMDLDTLVMLGCGRTGHRTAIDDGRVQVDGDAGLARRVVAGLPFTP